MNYSSQVDGSFVSLPFYCADKAKIVALNIRGLKFKLDWHKFETCRLNNAVFCSMKTWLDDTVFLDSEICSGFYIISE